MSEQTLPFTGYGEAMWAQEEKTPDLRFVSREGKLILQQRVMTTTKVSQTSRWVDVPVSQETP